MNRSKKKSEKHEKCKFTSNEGEKSSGRRKVRNTERSSITEEEGVYRRKRRRDTGLRFGEENLLGKVTLKHTGEPFFKKPFFKRHRFRKAYQLSEKLTLNHFFILFIIFFKKTGF